MFTPPADGPDPRPLMVIVDSRGRVRCWENLKTWPYVRDFVALCSATTPREYGVYLASCGVKQVISGETQVDLRTALAELNQKFGVCTIRVDSGGTLNSVLLSAGLVDTVSVLIPPCIAGGKPGPTLSDPLRAGITDLPMPLFLRSCEMQKNGIIWVQYSVNPKQGQ